MTNLTDNDHPEADTSIGADLPDAMRWRLRALRRDEPPSRDLWPDIAARLQVPASAMTPVRGRWIAPLAIAATLVIAVGATGLWRDGLPIRQPSPTEAASVTLVQREAAGLARQYDAALGEVATAQATPSPALQSTMLELDRSLSLIHYAISQDPDSRLLLDQLRRTYSHRLALAQRVASS